jgi:Zn-dependent protease with chaperone function
MIVALAAILAAGILLPHVLRLQRVAPITAVVLWLSALALRAIASLLGVVYLLFFLPRTEVFASLTHWCLHAALPLVTDELGVEGHGVGDLFLFVPGVVLVASLLVICIRTARAARAARRLVADHELGQGPRDSVIVSGPEVLFAVAGLKGPRVVVSAGALASLDDDELAAALDHERGHIARHHRFVMLAAVTLSALGRVLPGTPAAVREIAFHLERDADRWALRNRNDRLALARVICKAAATVEPADSAAVARLGATGVRERLAQLLEEPPRRHSTALNVIATAMVAFTLLLAAAVPTAAVAGAGSDAHAAHHGEHCGH